MSKRKENSTNQDIPIDYQIEIKNMQYTIILRDKEIGALKEQLNRNGTYIKQLESEIFDLKRQCSYNHDLDKKIGKLRHSNETLQQEIDKLNQDIEKEKIFEKDKCTNKIYLPRIQGINLVGLLIGPKGAFQKLLESNTGCKIYINGKFVKKKEQYLTFRDNDRPHVFIVGDSEEKVRKATRLVEEIIYADEATRNKIMQEQLKLSKQDTREENLNFEKKSGNTKDDDYLMTVSGPPGENARFYKIHNDYLGDVIGTNGETLKKIATDSNCKIHLGKALIPNTQLRYVFIEGTEENYQIAKRMIEKIIGDRENMKN